ncbi:Sec-independent protein translocase protein TatB [uncultured Algimonas sp.]|uniref:Sec-independent protein translocase protein TatB n=1 Tax=uncultured Algimonas sp. TaxID=1547920 RepID=UPI0026351747|nr:Sec-independent protein translocase protein TatB [uncultured Algimonas sp.]
MLPSFGFGEMVVIALLAVIVVGPKDLPKVMRSLGGFMARLRQMGQEFRDAFDEMDADDEIKSLRAEIAQMKSLGFLDEELDSDIRDLNTELRDTTDRPSDKT